MKNIAIIGGGTVAHCRSHLALSAVAYGNTARKLHALCFQQLASHWDPVSDKGYNINLYLTKMASGGAGNLETNEDVSNFVDTLVADPDTKIVFFNAAMCDYTGSVDIDNYIDSDTPSGKYEPRLKTSDGPRKMWLTPAPKVISKIRKERKDIFLVAFKTTCGATEDEQFIAGLNLLKKNSCNLVLANDTKTRVNMIITPEQARYSVTTDRDVVLRELVSMALARSKGTFTRSTIVDGPSIDWNSEEVPDSLRKVVNYCRNMGAYKTFNGSSVGHFATKKTDDTFYTSKRKTDYNKLDEVGLVKVVSSGPESVVAYGSRPSVGGASQRVIFKEHPEMDCIAHFHCKPKDIAKLSVRSQRENECGSTNCGVNTSNGLRLEEDGIKCVYLDKHGPNIVFNSSIDPQRVIEFIDRNFDLSKSTDDLNG